MQAIQCLNRAGVCLVVAFLIGCGDDKTAAPAEPAPSSSRVDDRKPEARPALSLEQAVHGLSEDPIEFAAFTQQLPPVVTETAACPFLADDKALNAARTNKTLIRRSVANDRCRWSINMGFSVKAEITPLQPGQSARNPTYNMDVEPVVKPQSGPGENARVLYDTAWDEERPYAFLFEQAGQSILIMITGMDTDEQRLRTAADDIAQRLSDMPVIEAQQRTVEPVFDLCETWDVDHLVAVLGAVDIESASKRLSGNNYCEYSIYLSGGYSPEYHLQVGLQTYAAKPEAVESRRQKGAEDLPGFTRPAIIETITAEQPRTSIAMLRDGHMLEVWVSSHAPYGKAANIALAKNLFKRLEQ